MDPVDLAGRGGEVGLGLLLVLAWGLTGCALHDVESREDPLTPREHLDLGLAYEENGEFNRARRQYRKGASNDHPIGFFYLGNLYFKQGKYNRAETAYLKALEKLPAHADVRNNLAWLYYKQGRNLEEAARLARRAIQLRPGEAKPYRDTLQKILTKKGTN